MSVVAGATGDFDSGDGDEDDPPVKSVKEMAASLARASIHGARRPLSAAPALAPTPAFAPAPPTTSTASQTQQQQQHGI